jgi:K+/H+ antiporter YhaU regulatory subunit KhtT
MGVIRQERVDYNPTAELRLAVGDTLMLLGEEGGIIKARELLHGRPI